MDGGREGGREGEGWARGKDGGEIRQTALWSVQ